MKKSILVMLLVFMVMVGVAQAYSIGEHIEGSIVILNFVTREEGYNVYVASEDGSWSANKLMIVCSLKALVGVVSKVRGVVLDYYWIDTLKLPVVVLY